MNRMTLPALLLRGTLCGLALLAPATVWAQTTPTDCPTEIPAASSTRRALAKDWFSRAEAAEAASDPIGAVKAYQCSLRLVPHAFTAFNLGRLAERTGDLELAVESFNTYLKLSPEAQDKTEIEAKLAALNERIRSLRTEQLPLPPPGTATAPPVPDPNTSSPTTSSPLPDLRPADTSPSTGADATAVADSARRWTGHHAGDVGRGGRRGGRPGRGRLPEPGCSLEDGRVQPAGDGESDLRPREV